MVATMDASVGQGALSGAGTGAKAGAAFGPWGAAIGAAIGGAIGSVGGFMSGKKKKKAKRYARMAAQLQQQREDEAYKQNFLSQIRQARISRASALASIVAAGSEEGSGAEGALSSYGAQTGNIVEYLSVDRGRAKLAAAYSARAQKNASTASAIDQTTQGLINLGGSIAQAYATSTPQDTTPVYSFGENNSLTIQQGPYLDSSGKLQYVKQGQNPVTLTLK